MFDDGLLGLDLGTDGGELFVKRRIAEVDNVGTGLASILGFPLDRGVQVLRQ